jgi:excisionase family DNA binding protein
MASPVQNNPIGIAENGAHASPHVSSVTSESLTLLTVDDVARQLNVSRSKIYGLIARGDLTVHRLPAIRVSHEQIREFLDGCQSRSGPSNPSPSTIRLKHLK